MEGLERKKKRSAWVNVKGMHARTLAEKGDKKYDYKVSCRWLLTLMEGGNR
jgi:hypothetical protein